MEKQVNDPINDPVDREQLRSDCHSIHLQNQFSRLNVEGASESVAGSTTNPEKQHNENRMNETVIIGDSIVKHIDPRKLTRKKVHKFTYPGKTIENIEKELNHINIQSPPSHVIVDAGTNNILTDSTEDKDKFPDSKVGFSGITTRQGIDVAVNIEVVDKKLKEISVEHNVSFINNSSIDSSSLNGSNLHLDGKGSAFLATHFRSSTIKQVGGMLKAILTETSRTIPY